MAQFTGRLRVLVNGEGAQFGVEPKDRLRYKLLLTTGAGPWVCGLKSLQIRKSRCSRYNGSRTTRVYASSSSSSSINKPKDSGPEASGDSGGFLEVDDGFETDELACFRGLVLDITYRPVNIVCWKRAICLEFAEKADVLEYYDQTVSSPSGSFNIPAVLRVPHLIQVVKRRRVRSCLSRRNILLRDDYTCQYCSSRESLTIDHVLPVSRGGDWTWENLVAACAKCNSRKGQKTLEEANMKLLKAPKAPKDYDIVAIPLTSTAIRVLRSRKGMPEEWRQYLGKASI